MHKYAHKELIERLYTEGKTRDEIWALINAEVGNRTTRKDVSRIVNNLRAKERTFNQRALLDRKIRDMQKV